MPKHVAAAKAFMACLLLGIYHSDAWINPPPKSCACGRRIVFKSSGLRKKPLRASIHQVYGASLNAWPVQAPFKRARETESNGFNPLRLNGISSLLKIVLGSRLLQYLWRCLFKGNGSYENGVTSNFLASPGNSGAALETAELSLSTALLKLKEAEAQQKGHVLKTRAAAAHAAYVAAEANTAVEAAEVAAAEAQRDLEKALAAQAAADEAATTKAGNPTMATSAAVISTAAAKINIRKPSISTAETRCETPTVTSRAHRAAESAPSRPLAQPIVAAKKAVVVEVEVVEPTRGLTKQNSAAIAFARPFFGEALKRGRSLVARPEVAPQMVHETAMGGQRMRYDTKQNFPRSWPQGLSGTLCAVLD